MSSSSSSSSSPFCQMCLSQESVATCSSIHKHSLCHTCLRSASECMPKLKCSSIVCPADGCNHSINIEEILTPFEWRFNLFIEQARQTIRNMCIPTCHTCKGPIGEGKRICCFESMIEMSPNHVVNNIRKFLQTMRKELRAAVLVAISDELHQRGMSLSSIMYEERRSCS